MTASRRVFITGGTGTLGQSLVKAFSRDGYEVTFQFHSNSETAKHLSETCGATALAMDLSATPAMRAPTDILINNAGINECDERADEVSEEIWEKTLTVNLSAAFHLTKSALPRMSDQKWGRIINISSIYGLRACEGNLAYTVSKHGLSGLTKTIAKEYAAQGITSNEICPGAIESEMMVRIARRVAETDGGTAEQYLDSVRQSIPAGRLANPDEIAELALFLASDRAAYINGVSIPIDGGLIA